MSIRRLAFLFVLSLLAVRGVRAQQRDWAPNIVVPQSRVIAPPRRVSPVQIKSFETTIDINDRIASTTLRITLFNPSRTPQEAELVVPVPGEATIRAFNLEGLGTDGSARILARQEARRIYESIVRQMKDPAILEFAGFGFVRSNVFPVAPNATQTITLTYEQLLGTDATRLDYVLPRTQSLKHSDTAWKINVRVRSKAGIRSLYSPSHTLIEDRPRASTTPDGAPPTHKPSTEVRVKVAGADEPGSFRLSVLLAGSDGSVMLYPDPSIQGGYFMLLATPPAPDANAPKVRREVTIVLDRSGSMRGKKIEQARNAALQTIEALDDGELFNIIDYSDTIESFSDHPVAKNTQSIAQARSYVARIKAVGGTNIHDALIEALTQPASEHTLPIVLFLTDGLPTIGKTAERDIREAISRVNTHHRRIFTFGVGFDVNAPLLSALSRQSRGSATFVQPDEDAEVKIGAMFAKLSGPVLSSPRYRFSTNAHAQGVLPREVLPRELGDVFTGEQIVLVGRYSDTAPTTIIIEGDQGSRQRTMEFTLDPRAASARNGFVPRLWASRKIASLIEQIRLVGADRNARDDPRVKELIDEVVRLSTEFGVMTEYTAFLADENPKDTFVQMERAAGGNIRHRALEDRAGRGAVSQELNLGVGISASKAPAAQRLYVASVGEDTITERVIDTLQLVNESALYRRDGRWVDGRLLSKEGSPPDETVEFASERYFQIALRLASQGRQALLAHSADTEILLDGRRVLIEAPE